VLFKLKRLSLKKIIILLCLSILGNGCFITKATIEEIKILSSRTSITKIINNPSTDKDLTSSLKLVSAVRNYCKSIGLNTSSIFTSYSSYGDETISWIVSAAPKNRLELLNWWFPLVGSVPYMGFFNRDDALVFKLQLKAKGYDTTIRPSSAFSTLGWFNDPVTPSIINHGDLNTIQTIIHELVHATIWIPSSVDFNESLAHYISLIETINFLKSKDATNWCTDKPCKKYIIEAEKTFKNEKILAQEFLELENKLNQLYTKEYNIELLRKKLFLNFTDNLRKLFKTTTQVDYTFLESPNNAILLHELIYRRFLLDFNNFFERLSSKICKRRVKSSLLIDYLVKITENNTSIIPEKIFKATEH
jgi:predicted aminopeptidase